MDPTTKSYNLDPSSDYSFKNCMLWGVSRAHFGKISVAWEKKSYSTAFKHLVLCLLEAIPILGQVLSLAEKRLACISPKIQTNNTIAKVNFQTNVLPPPPSSPTQIQPFDSSKSSSIETEKAPTSDSAKREPSSLKPFKRQRLPWVAELASLNLSPLEAQNVTNTLDLFTHAHEILPGLFLGNLRAYFSLDKAFLEKHSKDFLDQEGPSLACQSTVLTHEQRTRIPEIFIEREKNGTAALGIKHVVSVTQFKPKETVDINDWSRFEPNLAGIDRYQVRVDDDNLAWQGIQTHLPEIFAKFEQARQKREPILIHCTEGKSRSVIVLIAYFMSWGIPYEKALKGIQAVRSQASPKSDLLKPFQEIAKQLFPYNPTENFAYIEKAWSDPNIPYPGIVVLQNGLQKLAEKS